jgi:cell division protein FtsB
MNENDLKEVINVYQQKTFELLTKNVVLEAQINQLKTIIESITEENRALKSLIEDSQQTEDY